MIKQTPNPAVHRAHRKWAPQPAFFTNNAGHPVAAIRHCLPCGNSHRWNDHPCGTCTTTEGTQPPIIIDVRTRDEYSAGHIDTAMNLPHDELEHRLGEIPGDKFSEIVMYCRSGKRVRVTESILVGKGYTNIRDLAGHWQGWSGQAK